jgi:hypothetical protein
VILLASAAVACAPAVPSGTVLSQGCTSGIQNGQTFSFDGTGGTVLNLAVDEIDGHFVGLVAPGGSVLHPDITYGGISKFTLPVTGRYTIHVDAPPIPYLLRLCVSVDEQHGQVGLGTTILTALPGQRFYYLYDGTAGEHVDAAGAQLTDDQGATLPSSPKTNTEYIVPADGTYRVVASGTFTLSHPVEEGAMPFGQSVTAATVNGQYHWYTVTVDPGTPLGLFAYPEFVLIDPSASASTEEIARLDEAGTYRIGVRALSGAVLITSLNPDLDGGRISQGSTVAHLQQGQGVTYTYAGAAGERITIHPSPPFAGTPPAVIVTDQLGGRVGLQYDPGIGGYWTLPAAADYRITIYPTTPACCGVGPDMTVALADLP